MAYPINAQHRLLLEDNTSFLLLEDNSSKVILDEIVALDDPLNAATLSVVTPPLTFAGELAGITPPTPKLVQIKVDSTAGTTTSLNTPPTVGNIIVAGMATAIVAEPINPTDNRKNIFNKANSIIETISNDWVQLFVADVNVGGTSTYTVTHPANQTIIIAEISGASSENIKSATAWANTGSPSVSITPVANNSMVIVVGYDEGSVAQTAGSGFTVEGNEPDNVSHERFVYEDQLVATPTPITATWGNAVTPWAMVAIALRPKQLTYEIQVDTVNTFNSTGGLPLLDKTSDIHTGFADDIIPNANDRLLLEDNTSLLLLEDTVSKFVLNYGYPASDYVTYTIPAATLSNNTTYFWRVRQKQTNGVYGPYSSIQSFTISLPIANKILIIRQAVNRAGTY